VTYFFQRCIYITSHKGAVAPPTPKYSPDMYIIIIFRWLHVFPNAVEVGRREIDVITVPDKSSMLVHEPKMKVDLTKYLDNQNFW
jgi:hypothetical protein